MSDDGQEHPSLANTLAAFATEADKPKLAEWMNENFIWMRVFFRAINEERERLGWQGCADKAEFTFLWADRFDTREVKSRMLEVRNKCLEFGQAHDPMTRRKIERLADFQHIFSKEESFDNIKVVFDLLAGPPRRVSKSELVAYLCQTPNATIAKLIDTMIDWEFICRHKFYELKEGIDKFEIGDQERPYLQEFCSGWLGKIKAQEEAEENEETKKAAMEEYKALWNPFSEFIAEKTQEAWEEADIRHNYLWRSYFGTEGNPDLASEFPVPRSPARTQGVAFVR